LVAFFSVWGTKAYACIIGVTKKGWIEEPIAIHWLGKVFLPLTTPEDPSEWRLLAIDGHHTHTTVDFMWECFSNKVYIVFLPAHCSHLLQPLDVAIFGPLKTVFMKHLDQQGCHDASSAVSKKRFLYCYHKARMEAITEANIRSGWRATGLWPISRHRALGSHFIEYNSFSKRLMGSIRQALSSSST
jgi:4-hydroxybenzoate polyprenyltransferase